MRQAVYDVLAPLRASASRHGQHDMPSGRVWPAQGIRTAFENAVEEATLDDFRFHDCRHDFASWFMMRGGRLTALQKILGHQDIKLTLRYAHLSPGHLRLEMERTSRNARGRGARGTRVAQENRACRGVCVSS
jgi:integrase